MPTTCNHLPTQPKFLVLSNHSNSYKDEALQHSIPQQTATHCRTTVTACRQICNGSVQEFAGKMKIVLGLVLAGATPAVAQTCQYVTDADISPSTGGWGTYVGEWTPCTLCRLGASGNLVPGEQTRPTTPVPGSDDACGASSQTRACTCAPRFWNTCLAGENNLASTVQVW